MKAAFLILLAPVFSWAVEAVPSPITTTTMVFVTTTTLKAVVTTTTVKAATTTTTTTTVPAKKQATAFKFTSPLLNKIMAGEAPASDLPYWYGFRWNRSIHPVLDTWTEFLYKEIETHGPALLETTPKMATNFCPQFEKLNRDERILFWVRLATILMSFESSYKPDSTYDDSKSIYGNEQVISTGLMMISHGSAMRSDYNCDMINPNPVIGNQDLKDPFKNMACGVRIMNHWIKTDGIMADALESDSGAPLWRGLARYWGPFRHVMLSKDKDGLWAVFNKRMDRWQDEANHRDEYLLKAVKTALHDGGPNFDKRIWEANTTEFPHGSMLDDKYASEESHRFTAMARLLNQTGFCYK